jgi:hypothetical protein
MLATPDQQISLSDPSGWNGCRVGLAPTGKRRLVTAHTHSGRSSLRNRQRFGGPGQAKACHVTELGPTTLFHVPKDATRQLCRVALKEGVRMAAQQFGGRYGLPRKG